MVSDYQDLSSTSSEKLLQTAKRHIFEEGFKNLILVTYHQREGYGHYNHAVTLLKYQFRKKTTMLFLDVSNVAKGQVYHLPAISDCPFQVQHKDSLIAKFAYKFAFFSVVEGRVGVWRGDAAALTTLTRSLLLGDEERFR